MGIYEFPGFDPVALDLGIFQVRWYALAYIGGLMGAWRYGMWLAKRPPGLLTPKHIDDFLIWATLGVILGGRLGYVIFYKPAYYLENLAEIPQMWNGGMSFHGGLAGVILAAVLFTRRHGIAFFALADILAAVTPIGLFLGRIANFINGELWGRPTDGSFGVIFRHAGDMPRHPSQLYEAVLEGLLLFVILTILVVPMQARRRVGLASGVFMIGYGLSRMLVETVREPDEFIGLLAFGTTWGQWLSMPMVALGLYLVIRGMRRPPVDA